MPPPRIRLADVLSRLRIARFAALPSIGSVRKPLIIFGQCALAYHLITTYIGSIGATHGVSMVPTIPSGFQGTPWIVQSRLHRRGRNIRVGDVIAFQHPVNPNGRMCKRIIGMPGDLVSVMTPCRGEEDLTKKDAEGDWANAKESLIRVPEGHCWVAGDNLDWSRDSRLFGPLPLALIKGKVLGVVWPIGAWKWFGGKSQLEDVTNEEREWVRG
jgi:inner membrane protease subunit 1